MAGVPNKMRITWVNPPLNKAGRDGVRRALESFKKTLIVALDGARSGKTYSLPGGGTYIASAPGEYPAKKKATDNLKDSLRVVSRTIKDVSNTFYVGTDIWYGEWLETQPVIDGGRPWMSKHYMERRVWMIALVEKQFKKIK